MSTYRVKNYAHKKTRFEGQVRIHKVGTYGYAEQNHSQVEIVTEYESDFEIEIDIDKILTYIVKRAASSKAGRAQHMGGWIKAKRKSSALVQEARHEHPIPEGWKIGPYPKGENGR